MNIVGPKGQVVIDSSIRKQLGIAPGWRAIQTLNGDRIEIRFVPPEHSQSFFGVLSAYAKDPAPTEEEMDLAISSSMSEDFVGDRSCES